MGGNEKDLNTGVEELHDAGAEAGTGEPQGSGVTEEEESYSLADLFPETDGTGVEDGEADQLETGNETGDADQQRELGEKAEIAFARKLKVEREKIEEDYARQLGVSVDEAKEIILEHKAKEYMEKHKDMNMTLEFAKEQVAKGGETQQPAAKKEATTREEWEARVLEEDAKLTRITGGSASVESLYGKDKVFTDAMNRGEYPLDAYAESLEAKKGEEARAATLKKQAEEETVAKIRASAARTVADTSKGRVPKSALEKVKSMTPEERERINREVIEGNKKVYLR